MAAGRCQRGELVDSAAGTVGRDLEHGRVVIARAAAVDDKSAGPGGAGVVYGDGGGAFRVDLGTAAVVHPQMVDGAARGPRVDVTGGCGRAIQPPCFRAGCPKALVPVDRVVAAAVVAGNRGRGGAAGADHHTAGSGVGSGVQQDRAGPCGVELGLLVERAAAGVALADVEPPDIVGDVLDAIPLLSGGSVGKAVHPPVAPIGLDFCLAASLVAVAYAQALMVGNRRVNLAGVPITVQSVGRAVEGIVKRVAASRVGDLPGKKRSAHGDAVIRATRVRDILHGGIFRA